MKSERVIREQLKQIELDIRDAERFYEQTKAMAGHQIADAHDEYERVKRDTKAQVAEAMHKLTVARIRRSNFIRYHQVKEL